MVNVILSFSGSSHVTLYNILPPGSSSSTIIGAWGRFVMYGDSLMSSMCMVIC